MLIFIHVLSNQNVFVFSGQNGSGVTCCRSGQFIDPSIRHPDCFAITIPADDPFYARFGQNCMEFVRSLPAVRPQCTFGPREQVILQPNVMF